MELSQLAYFRAVARTEHFTRAAEELHITQSALSRSIAQLESDIGIQLFERRKGGKITMNRDGRFLNRPAQEFARVRIRKQRWRTRWGSSIISYWTA